MSVVLGVVLECHEHVVDDSLPVCVLQVDALLHALSHDVQPEQSRSLDVN